MPTPAARRAVTAAAAATATTAGALACAVAPAEAMPIPTPLPSINMEKVVLAAQLDPHRPSTGVTKGAKSSVLAVERALHAKGLLAGSWVDGSFGSKTTAAWRAWEKRVHSTSHPWTTNGLPGLTELKKLGANRFTINHQYSPGTWVTENGETIDNRTRAMFHKAEARSGTNMTIVQGRGNASASASTHLGGGVIDIRTWDRPGKTGARVRALRAVGFAAWHRTRAQGFDDHIHAVAVNDPYIAYGSHFSICQVYQFRFGGDGLSCSHSTAGANRPLVTWESFKRAH